MISGRTCASLAGLGLAVVSVMGLTAAPASALPVDVSNSQFAAPGLGLDEIRGLGPNTLPGWKIPQDRAVNLYGSRLAAHPAGLQAVDLNDGSPGTIETTVRTTPGQLYKVEWDTAVNSFSGCHNDEALKRTRETYTVTVDGQASAQQGYDVGTPQQEATGTQWKSASYSFKAGRRNSTLTFSSTNLYACGAMVTDVSVDEQ